MKKVIILVFVLLLAILPFEIHAASANEIRVTIDGRTVKFDVPPTMINQRIVVPMRAIFESLGATIEWDADTNTVTAQKDETVIILTVGDSLAKVNQDEVFLDVPSTLVDGRTMVPVRFIAEALGAVVEWDGEYQTVIIQSHEAVTGKVQNSEDTIVARPGEETTLTIQGTSGAKYSISVYYSSGPSKAAGLETKIADENGNVSWTWLVGTRTRLGVYKIEVKGNGQILEYWLNVRE